MSCLLSLPPQITKELGPVLYSYAAKMDYGVSSGQGQFLNQKVVRLHRGRRYTFLAQYLVPKLQLSGPAASSGLVFSVAKQKGGKPIASHVVSSPSTGASYQPSVINFETDVSEVWVQVQWQGVSAGVAFVDEMALFPTRAFSPPPSCWDSIHSSFISLALCPCTACAGCRNGGTRQSDEFSCRCSCPQGFTGESCQHDGCFLSLTLLFLSLSLSLPFSLSLSLPLPLHLSASLSLCSSSFFFFPLA